MPGGDRTGPQGAGPMTGRGMGYCADNNSMGRASGAARPRRYMAYRRGAGNGRGRGLRRNSGGMFGRGNR